jgi:hypothetical protein
MGFYPVAVVPQVSNNTQIIHITQNNTPRLHTPTQAIRDTLLTMNTIYIPLIKIAIN